MPERFWWRLPGPAHFVERLADDVRDGKNLVVTVPLHRPGRLGEAVRTALGSAWDWHSLSPPVDGGSGDTYVPAAWMLNRFAPDRDPAALPEPSALAAQSSLAG